MGEPVSQFLTRLLDSLPDTFILVLDQERRIIYANTSFMEQFGLEPQDLMGHHCIHLANAAGGPEAGEWFCPAEQDPAYRGRKLITREIQGKKFVFEVKCYPLKDEVENLLRVVVYQDVTHNRRLEQELRKTYELERKLIDASIDGIVANDLGGNVLIFNQGAARILGYTPEEVIGKLNVSNLYPPGQAHLIKEKIYEAAHGGLGILENYETMALHKNGDLVPVWLAARILSEDGRDVGIVGYFRDLRERKRLEEELLRHERLASLGRMVAHITHEIKNPLTVIGGFAHQLERLASMPREAGHKLRLIHEEVNRLEKFLSDLSSFTRSAPTQKTPGDVAALIREVGDMMQDSFKEKGVVFRVQAEEIPLFPFDAGQIRQVLVNIFKNALEAMPQGGELAVTAQVKENLAELTIRDTGQGIAPDHLQQLFTPFFSTKEKGTGLGLVICRRIIEQHRGDIRIDSQPERGATCTIRLPLNPG